jgi:hypothetical protein
MVFNLMKIKSQDFLKTAHADGYRTKVPGEKRGPYGFYIQQQQFPVPSVKAR